jgi:hypothetical protein
MSVFSAIQPLTDAEGALLNRPMVQLTEAEARDLRAAARLLRARSFRMIVRCDACFEGGRADGMRGEITRRHISLECRCRKVSFSGETL